MPRGGVRGEGRVAEVDLRRLPTAHETSDDLPDGDELGPRDALALVVVELAVGDAKMQQAPPLALRLAASVRSGSRQPLVRLAVTRERLAHLLQRVLVDALRDVPEVPGPGMGAHEEERRTYRRDAGVVEDVVPAFHRERRRDEDPGVVATELGDVAAAQQVRALPSRLQLVVTHQAPHLIRPGRLGAHQRVGDQLGLGVAADEQQHPLPAVDEAVPLPLQAAPVPRPRSGHGECLDHLSQRRAARFAVTAGDPDRRAPFTGGLDVEAERGPRDLVELLGGRKQDRVDRHVEVIARRGACPARAGEQQRLRPGTVSGEEVGEPDQQHSPHAGVPEETELAKTPVAGGRVILDVLEAQDVAHRGVGHDGHEVARRPS